MTPSSKSEYEFDKDRFYTGFRDLCKSVNNVVHKFVSALNANDCAHMGDICSIMDPGNSGPVNMLAYIARTGCRILGCSMEDSYVVSLGVAKMYRASVIQSAPPCNMFVESVMMSFVNDTPSYVRMLFAVGDDGWMINYHHVKSDSYSVAMQDGFNPFLDEDSV